MRPLLVQRNSRTQKHTATQRDSHTRAKVLYRELTGRSSNRPAAKNPFATGARRQRDRQEASITAGVRAAGVTFYDAANTQ